MKGDGSSNTKRKRTSSSSTTTTKSPNHKKAKPSSASYVPLKMFLKKNESPNKSDSSGDDHQQPQEVAQNLPLSHNVLPPAITLSENAVQAVVIDENSDANGAVQQPSTSTSSKIHPFFTKGFGQKKSSKLSLKNEGTIKVNDKSPDTVVASIAEVFMTSEQKKRKRELKNLQSFKENIEKSKELNPLFCKPFQGEASKHPLLLSMQKKDKSEAINIQLEHVGEDWDTVPLQNVSTSTVWTHGPAFHVLQNDDNYSRVSQPSDLLNTLISIEPLDYDQEEDERTVEQEINELMSSDKEGSWWFKYIGADETKSKRRVSSGGSCQLPSPIPSLENKTKTIEQYLKFADAKMLELSKKYTGFDSVWGVKLYKELVARRLNYDHDSFELFSNSGDLWTHKYRPLSKHEMVGCNHDVIDQLWSWMKDWESFRESTKKRSKEKKLKASNKKKIASFLFFDDVDYENESDGDSEDEFDPITNNLVMVTGDLSSGKTASVYASAQELGFHVFEINSSSERSQASMLKLIEMTQSHQIHRFLANKTATESSCQSERMQSSSLLLFEEVDNIYEPDKNFFAAIKKIQRSTKRPLILTSNSKIEVEDLTMCKQLNFSSLGISLGCDLDVVNGYILQKVYLVLLILMCEGLEVKNIHELHSLLQYCEGDLRRTILNVQFWAQEVDRLPCGMSDLFDKPIDMTVKSRQQFLERYLGLFYIASNLFDNTLSDYRIHYAVEDELSVSREQGLDIMFNNYLLSPSGTQPESIYDVCSYMDNLCAFEYMCERQSDSFYADDTSSFIYSSGNILNHARFIKGRSPQSQAYHSDIRPNLSTVSHVVLSNPLYRDYVKKSQQELLSLIRKTVSSTMGLQYVQPDIIDTVLSISSREEDKRGRRASRRYYHHFQDVFSTEELGKLGVVGNKRRECFQ